MLSSSSTDFAVCLELLKESPAVLSLGKLCEENGSSYDRHRGQPSCPIKNGRTIECNTEIAIPLVVPGVQVTEHQTEDLDGWKQTQAVGDHERRVETEVPEWLQPFKEGLTFFQFDRCISSCHPPAKFVSKKAGGKNNSFVRFPTDPNCEVCRRKKVTRSPCEEILTIGWTE